MSRFFGPLAAALFLCAGCTTTMTVSRTTDSDTQTKGARFWLPKPYLLVAPQTGGSISVVVIYLPDPANEYAVSVKSQLAANNFQIATDSFGILTGVQLNSDTTAIPAQVAATAGAGLAAFTNFKASEAAAVQTQVNTAQSNYMSAVAAYNAAAAAVQIDNENPSNEQNSTGQTQLQIDQSSEAQAQQKMTAALAALNLAQSSAQAVAASAAAGTPLSASGPASATALPTPGASVTSQSLSLPESYGPVLYRIDESDANGPKLTAVVSSFPCVGRPTSGDLPAQNQFATSLFALGVPVIAAPAAPFPTNGPPAVFQFSRGVNPGAVVAIFDSTGTEVSDPGVQLLSDKKTIVVPISKMTPGVYSLKATFKWVANSRQDPLQGEQNVVFIVTNPPPVKKKTPGK